MHKQFRELLENATGISQHIIAVVLDIRGFTPFCQTVDSLDVATYVKKVYMKVIDNYFSNASFYKPTGDGLLVVIPYNQQSLKEVVNGTMQSCLNLLKDFPDLCKDDPMVNFKTPARIGIGLARGSACCLSSGNKTLDYSGKVLNLASRLMELARPSGIVFDSGLGFELLSDEIKKLFSNETVYLRSVAEEEPITIYHAKDLTIIQESSKKPINEPKWENVNHTITFGKFELLKTNLTLTLDSKPVDEDHVILRVKHQSEKGYSCVHTFQLPCDGVDYEMVAKRHEVRIYVKPVAKVLRECEVAGSKINEKSKIRFDVDYLAVGTKTR
jgi:class 3 adenylate cyclase